MKTNSPSNLHFTDCSLAEFVSMCWLCQVSGTVQDWVVYMLLQSSGTQQRVPRWSNVTAIPRTPVPKHCQHQSIYLCAAAGSHSRFLSLFLTQPDIWQVLDTSTENITIGHKFWIGLLTCCVTFNKLDHLSVLPSLQCKWIEARCDTLSEQNAREKVQLPDKESVHAHHLGKVPLLLQQRENPCFSTV